MVTPPFRNGIGIEIHVRPTETELVTRYPLA